MPVTTLLAQSELLTAAPDPENVVAGWTAFVVFIVLILAMVVLGFSLVKRLKNVDRAAEEGKYDPSDPKKRPARGLGAARAMREAEEQGTTDGEAGTTDDDARRD